MIDVAEEIGLYWFYRVMQTVCREGRTPSDGKRTELVLIFKKGNRNFWEIFGMCKGICKDNR